MRRMISQRELRNESGAVMRELDAGISFIVTRDGVPVGELTPLKRRAFVPRERIVEIFARAPHIDARRFRADLDTTIDQDPTPRV